MVRSCTGCIDTEMPGMSRIRSFRRRSPAVARQAATFQWLQINLQAAVVDGGVDAINADDEDAAATAGSAIKPRPPPAGARHRRKRHRFAAPCDGRWCPVSRTGKNPFGTSQASRTVSARWRWPPSKVSPCRASTQSSIDRVLRASPRSKAPLAASQRGSRCLVLTLQCRRAHIIGVSVSDTKAEMMMAIASVMANSRNSRPTTSPHE